MRVLKTELKRKLHFIMGGAMDYRQPDKMTEFQQTYYIAIRQQAVLKILVGRTKTVAAFDLAQSLCELAMKYEFAEPIVTATATLKRYYLATMPDAKKYAYYKELNEKYTQVIQAERMANDFFMEIAATYVESRAPKPWLKALIEGYVQQLSPYKDSVNSFIFIYHSGMVGIWSCIVVNDYEKCLTLCDEYINRLTQKTFVYHSGLSGLYHRKVICCMMLKKYKEALATIEKAMTLVQPHAHNWFVNGLLQIQLSFHTQDYKQAVKKCIEVSQSPELTYQAKAVIEEFRICEAYLQWLVAYDKIKVTKTEKEAIGQFRLTRIINELPTFSKDKKGMNIPILMLQVLWFLAEKRYDEFLNRLDTLSKYKTRYLKEDENLRTNLIIKLLYQIPENGYDKRKVIRKTAGLYKSLVDADSTTYEIEVFPYNIFWNLVVDVL
jgi:tetratricopeptide (TPR) repeat protein